MTAEKPEIRRHIEFGADQTLAVLPAGFGNIADAVEHQHRRQRQLRIARAEQLAATARQQILVFVTAAAIQHGFSLSKYPAKVSLVALSSEPDPSPAGDCLFPANRRYLGCYRQLSLPN